MKSNQRAPASEKLAGLDAVRATAAMGVVMLHACVPYLQNPMPGLSWSVRDHSNPVTDCLFWGIEVCIMPVFLVLAGYFAWRSLRRRPPSEIVKSRAKRLLIPLLFGMVFVLPLDLYAWAISWVGEGIVAPVKLRSLKFRPELSKDLWGLSHLWFLQYLFLYIVVLCGAKWLYDKVRNRLNDGWKMPSGWISAAGCLLIGVTVLVFRPEVVWGFQHAFAPVPSKWIYSGTYFFGGAILASKNRPPQTWTIGPLWMSVLIAIAVLTIAVALGREHLSATHTTGFAVSLAIVTTVAAWSVTLCLIAMASRHLSSIPRSVEYLAAASFWVYLVHHPILGVVHMDLKILTPGLSPIVKMPIAFTISYGVSLLTYEGCVRKTRFGRWLGFAWSPKPKETGDSLISHRSHEKAQIQAGKRAA